MTGLRGWMSLGALAIVLGSASARAHEVGLSRGEYAAEGGAVRAEVSFARKELAGLVAGLDADRDGALTAAEIEAGRDAIQGAIVGRIKVTGDGAPCAGKLDRIELAEQDGVVVHARYRCARRPKQAAITLALMEDLPFGHRHLARAFAAAGPLDLVLSQRVPSFDFAVPADTAAPSSASTGALGRLQRLAAAWPVPVFLLGLLTRCAARRAMLAAAGAFAAALLAGLAASALHVFTPSPRAVAAAMSASLAYVGVDNLAGGDRRAWIALPFGFVHGLGCAAALSTARAGASLGSHALGVLAALALVIAALVVLVAWARARRAFHGKAAIALNLGIAAAGLAGAGLALWRR